MKQFNYNNGILIQGDCIEVMDKMIKQGVKVDAIITDPPYELDLNGGSCGCLSNSSKKLKKDINFISHGFDFNTFFEKCLQISKTPNLLIFCSNKQISKTMSFFENKKLSTTLLVWKKNWWCSSIM